jgi:hypothetical protein|tara:strand:+ start:38 stop:322 length:285 start_codon:yes stop_codon:yes gene_type:complete
MNVKVFRANTGEEVIFTLINEDENTIEVENPLVAMPSAQGQIGFGPWSYLQKEETTLTIDKKYIVYICDARDEVVDNYTKIFSTIETPSKKLIL